MLVDSALILCLSAISNFLDVVLIASSVVLFPLLNNADIGSIQSDGAPPADFHLSANKSSKGMTDIYNMVSKSSSLTIMVWPFELRPNQVLAGHLDPPESLSQKLSLLVGLLGYTTL